MKMGQIYRYARPYCTEPAEVDGLPNYFHWANSPGRTLSLLESGINPIQQSVRDKECPAILISSSPHKIGSEATPWQDFFRPDDGHIRYFGDNKDPDLDPSITKGNAALLRQFELHSSPDRDKRARSCPILFFKRVRVENRLKGNVQFHGFGIVERAERVVQFDRVRQRTFANYAFDFIVFSLADEAEDFDWKWIDTRRNPNSTTADALVAAPRSWRTWVSRGKPAVEQCRRRVSKLLVVTAAEQRCMAGSRHANLLEVVYRFYDGRKSRFEALAAFVAGKILNSTGAHYRHGWITPSSADGGADFVGRLDLGSELARVKLVVLGQAKCERPDTPTGGNHIARTVARLRRGWIGVYVTTSYFSEAVQREVIEDQYPIMLVDGGRLVRELDAITHERGEHDVSTLLGEVDDGYASLVAQRRPEEILLE